MTLGEALEELGIGPDTASEEARRAYLRLLRTRKPETDPVGFQRLREAYETVRGTRSPFRSPRAAAPSPHVARPAPPPAPPPAGSPKATALHTPVIVRREPPPATPVAPRMPRPAARTSPPAARTPPAAPVVDGEDGGDELFLVTDRAPVPAWTPVVPPDDATDEAVRAACVGTASAYVRATGRLDVAAPSPAVAIDSLFLVHERAMLDLTARLHDAFRAWLRATGDEVRLLGPLAGRWVLLGELRRLSPSLLPEVRAIVVRAAKTGEMQEAREQLQRIHARDPRAYAQARLLRAGGPLCADLADPLHPVIPMAPRLASLRPRVLLLPLLLVVPFLVALLFWNLQGYSPEPERPPAPDTPATRATDVLIREASSIGSFVAIAHARDIAKALQERDCATARLHADALGESSEPSLRDPVAALRAALLTECAAPAPAPS